MIYNLIKFLKGLEELKFKHVQQYIKRIKYCYITVDLTII